MTEEWPLTRVVLRVLDLHRESAFYSELGLRELRRTASTASFGADGRELLTLWELPNLDATH